MSFYNYKIFNKYTYFYSYDIYSFLLPIAALCGCIPIAIPIEGCDTLEDAYQEEWMLKGIAYGDLEAINMQLIREMN